MHTQQTDLVEIARRPLPVRICELAAWVPELERQHGKDLRMQQVGAYLVIYRPAKIITTDRLPPEP